MAEHDTTRARRRPVPTRLPAAKKPPAKKRSISKAVASHLEEVHSRVVRDVEASLVSAAEMVEAGSKESASAPQANAVARTWQHACYGYSRSVPELSAAQIYVGNCLSRVQLVVGKRDPDGTVEQGFDGDAPAEGLDADIAQEAAALISLLRSGSGGQSELLRRFGENAFLVGEIWLVPMDTPYGLSWEALSTSELTKTTGGTFAINNGPGMGTTELDKDTVPLRVWRPDSQYRKLASSSVRACIEILEELVILTRLVRSAAISRIALAGILAIADEFDSPDEEGEDGETSESSNPLAVDMINIGSKAIDDPASAAAWMPYILQGNVDLIEKGIRHIALQSDSAEHIVKRQEAVERLARGVDLPVEAVMGHQQTTFANAMQVSQDVWNLHLAPMMQLLCDALTIGYLWPAMARARNIDPDRIMADGYPDEILAVAVTHDARKLISRPDRAKEILDAYEKDKSHTAIANSELREAIGLNPDGGPDEQEMAMRIDAIRLTNIRETVRIDAPQLADEAAALPISEVDGAPIPGQSDGADLLIASARLGERISGAAELTIDRCCEKVGAKLKSHIKTKPAYDAIRQAVEDVPNGTVARILGPEVAERILGGNDPIAAELLSFRKAVKRWAAEARLSGVDAIADRAVDVVATKARLCLFGETLVAPSEDFAALISGP